MARSHGRPLDAAHPMRRLPPIMARTWTQLEAMESAMSRHRFAPLFPRRRARLLCGLSLAVLLLLLLPGRSLGQTNTNPSLIFPLAVSGGYKPAEMDDTTAFPRLATVLSPAALVGRVAFAVAPFSGPMFRNDSCTGAPGEDCRVTFQMQLLNSLDNQYGCLGVNQTALRNVTDGGERIGPRSMMLVERSPSGFCNFGTKAQNVATTGAGAIMHHGCNPAPPQSCASGLAITLSHLNISISCPYMQWFDAMRMQTYLQGRDAWLRAQANANSSMSSTGGMGPSGFESSSTGSAEPCNCSCSGGNTPTPPAPGPEVFTDFTEPLLISFPATGPMLAQDRAALFTIVNNLQTADPVNGVNDALLVGPWTSLRGWGELTSHPDRDPCLDRVVGMWCENGRLTSVNMFGFNGPNFAGAVDPAWGNLTALFGLELSNNYFQGALPPELCALTSLMVLGMDRESDGVRVNVRQGLTQLPECIGDLPLVFLSMSTNLIANFPASLRSANGLRVLVLDHNSLQLLPTDFSTNLMGLYQLDITFNTALGGPPPSFRGWQNVSYLQAHHCGFTGGLQGGNDAFNDMSILTQFDISFNAITGALPIFDGCVMLQSIALNDNQFSGSIPVEWSELDQVTTLKVQNNAIIAPVRALGGMVSLTSLDISNNSLRLPASYNGDAGQFIADMAPNSIVTMILDRNEIAGTWSGGLMSSARNVDTLSFAYNQVQKLPADMFTYGVTHWDASYNALTGGLPPNNPLFATSLSLQGNPGLNIWPLPEWLEQTLERSATPGSPYSCTVLDSPVIKNFHISVDAASRQYQGCSCIPGSFGRPPLCDAVPERATVNPQDGFSSAEIGPNFVDMIAADSASNDADDSGADQPSAPGALQPNTTAPNMAYPAGFSDDWYGNQRLTLGVATTWYVNLQDLYFDTAGPKNGTYPENELRPMANGLTIKPTKGVDIVQLVDANGNLTHTASISIPPSARFQPVRMIRMCIHISRALFTKPSDVLTVYEGDPSFSGLRVVNLLGTDSFPDPPPYPPLPGTSAADLSITQTAAYQARYAISMADIQNRSLVELVVKSNAASLHFTSRATEGTHFFATYTYVFTCEPLTRYYLDPVTNLCHEQLPRYPLAASIRHAVFSVSGWALGWILINVAAILYKWQSPLYRAASRQFMLLTLGMLALMSLGAMLYAAVPNVWVSPDDGITPVSNLEGRALCLGRVWLSCVPLAGILGVVLAKTNRVHNIFGSMTLLKAKSVSDGAIFKSVGALLLVECVFLLVFSLIPLSRPDMRPGIGGSLENYLVLSCSLENGAYIWIGIQIAFFATLMTAAGVMAFRTRNLPSAFNESAHISNCITVLIFFGCILVPLVLYVHQQPEAAILLQGLGQALLVMLLTTILFAPKLYTAFTTTFAQQKQMMNDERTSGTGAKLGGSGGAPSPGGRASSYAPPSSLDAPDRLVANPARNISSARRPSGLPGAMVASSTSPRNYPRTSIRPVMPRTMGAIGSSHQSGASSGLLGATPNMAMTPSTSSGGTVHPALELKTGILPPGAGSSSTPPESPAAASRPRDVSTVPEAPEAPEGEPASAAGIEARMEQEAASAMAEMEPEDAEAADNDADRRESDPPPPPPPGGDRVDRY